MTVRYSKEQLLFLREGYPQMTVPELTEAFNNQYRTTKTPGQIKSTLKNHKMRCGRPVGSPKGTFIKFTNEQYQYLKDHYPHMPRTDLVAAFNRRFSTSKSVSQVVGFMKNQGIKSGRTGRYAPGSVPANKGTKGLTGANSTSFKTGQIPANIKPLGDERVCRQQGYILVKVAETNPYTGASTRYRAKHQVVWEQHHGPIPEDHVVSFKNSNKLDCRIENLMLLTKAQHLFLNRKHYRTLPDEIRPVMVTLAKVTTSALELERSSQKG